VSYTARPELYDVVYSFKDYAAESAQITALVRERAPHARTLLDVACGTGKHLEYLRDQFACEGVDLDEGLLAIARRRLPDMPLHVGDMRTLDLGRRFDVVTCLFSAIGFVRDLDGLAAAAGALARHVADGGVLVVEPWITPEAWRSGEAHALGAEAEGLAVARLTVTGREGRISTLQMETLVGDSRGIDQFAEHLELGLFTDDEMRSALEAGGLRVEHDPEGLIGRGLWLGTRA
jgi:SAM-dependent methyltransferase